MKAGIWSLCMCLTERLNFACMHHLFAAAAVAAVMPLTL